MAKSGRLFSLILNVFFPPFGVGLKLIPTHHSVCKNQLTSLPHLFGHLTALTQLNLSNNQFTSLPDSFGDLRALTKFFLKDNNFDDNPKHEIQQRFNFATLE